MTEKEFEDIIKIYFEEVEDARDQNTLSKCFSMKWSKESFKHQVDVINRNFNFVDIVMGGGFGTGNWNPDRKILIASCRDIIAAGVWTNKRLENIRKSDKDIKNKIESRWKNELGIRIIECT